MITYEQAYEHILECVTGLPIIDTHEHLPGSERKRDPSGDFFTEYLSHYFNRDLISAGMPKEDMTKVLDASLPVMERWRLCEPYWALCRHTGYGRALDKAVQAVYGLPRIDGSSVEALDEAFRRGLTSGSHYELVLKQKSRILISLLDSDLDCDRRYFRSMLRLDEFILPKLFSDIEKVQRTLGAPVHSFTDWLDGCEALIDRACEAGAVGFKTAMAYERSLLVEDGSYQEAERCFREFWRNSHLPDWAVRPVQPSKAYQDYMLHHILRRVAKRDMTVQVHTGMQEGNGNLLQNANPSQLCGLLLRYPDVRFVLMHIGYPYQLELSAIGKMFPNAFLDMCWAHIISPNASRLALREWLDAVPANKICAFGGDYLFVDGVCGHQALAREDVSAALASKVCEDLMDVDEAFEIARRLFVQNPYDIFRLKRADVELDLI
jgi:hypothetical protein